MKKAEKLKKLNIGKKPFFIVISMILFIAIGGSFAWYLLSGQKHKADTDELKIMSPYFLYLLNPDDSSSLQFSVGNIHPGEVKQVVICVSNQKPTDSVETVIDIAKDSDFNYDLEFIYTENLPLDYKVYELTKNSYDESDEVPDGSILIEDVDDFYWTKRLASDSSTVTNLSDKNVSEERWEAVFNVDTNGDGTIDKSDYSGVENKGQYLLFQTDAIGAELHLTYKNSKYEYDYYLIEMSWKENANFSDNAKETDLLYVVVNAKQPEPTKKSETESE